jgi:hypothetical protein
MRGSRRSLLRQASVLIVLCCAFAVGAGQALAQDPAPEPAPPNSSGPKPEAPPGANRQPETPATRATPPPPPAAEQPPPPPTTPPPAAVTPPPAPAVTPVYRPPATQERRDTRAQGREAAKPKPKTSKPKPEQKVTQAAAPALPGLSREEATSPDTMLLAGGLALFVLVLADMVFLTLSTRVMRAR